MAEVKPNYDTNRKKLADIIPLEQPFTVYIEQTKFCNLKCFYCIHSTRDDINGEFIKLGHKSQHMEIKLYEKIINDLKSFPSGGIKRIVFSGLGEPLMNPKLPYFVKMAVNSKIAERVEVITNGLLFEKETVDSLIEAGITNINISVQGLTANDYERVGGKKIDYSRFLSNLEYLYKNKKQAQIYIKAIDATLPLEKDKKQFFELFSKVADKIYIEHLVVMQQQMEDLKDVVDGSKNFYGETLDANRKVCAQSFYFLQIGADGETYPCPVPGLGKGISMGNANNESLITIWNGEKRKSILRKMLQLRKDDIPECRNCTCFNAINNPAENLDLDAKRLLKLF